MSKIGRMTGKSNVLSPGKPSEIRETDNDDNDNLNSS